MKFMSLCKQYSGKSHFMYFMQLYYKNAFYILKKLCKKLDDRLFAVKLNFPKMTLLAFK